MPPHAPARRPVRAVARAFRPARLAPALLAPVYELLLPAARCPAPAAAPAPAPRRAARA